MPRQKTPNKSTPEKLELRRVQSRERQRRRRLRLREARAQQLLEERCESDSSDSSAVGDDTASVASARILFSDREEMSDEGNCADSPRNSQGESGLAVSPQHPQDGGENADSPQNHQDISLLAFSAQSDEDADVELNPTSEVRASQDMDTTQSTESDEDPQGIRDVSLEDQRDELSRAVASVRATSVCSDEAIEKLFKVVASRADSVKNLLEAGLITKSYKKSLKSIAIRGIPKVYCAISVQNLNDPGGEIVRLPPVRAIPKKYLKPMDNQRLLRTDSYVNLCDIADFHIRLHRKLNYTEEEITEQLQNMDVSIDGVRESAKGQRKFVAVSVRFLSCIYLWRIYNPLVGDDASKPSMDEILK